ncbi:glycosyltransferase family 2 protein [Methylocaldum sp. MU1018]
MNVITSNHRVAAIVVVYRPDLDRLGMLVRSTLPQVSSCVLVINEAPEDLPAHLALCGIDINRLSFVSMGHNQGVATAQNAGIAVAREVGATHVLLLDQDSVPASDMVIRLLEVLANYPDAAAAGPRYVDSRQENPPPFIRVSGLHLTRYACATECSVVPVDYLISSGCLIPLSVLDTAGDMRDDLFIDYVDIEWGLRARKHGLQSYGVCAAKMQHNLGEHPLEFFGRKIPLHTPLRHYFHFRNAILLYREAWVPLNWKLVDGWRLLLKYGFYTLFARPRVEHFRMMSLGLWHGILDKGGPVS